MAEIDKDLSDEMEAKMKYKFSAIEKRNEERAEHRQKAREAELEKGDERTTDLVVDFYKNLNIQVSKVEEELKKASDLDASLVPAHLDETYRLVCDVQKYVTDAVMFLPAYDVGKAQNTVKELNSKFQDTQSQVQPKKKFGFKGARQKKLAAPPTQKPDEDSKSEVDSSSSKIKMDMGISIRGKRGEHNLELSESETSSGDVSLSDLDGCHVVVRGTPSTLHMSNINNCRIFAGPVSSSIFIDNCNNSVLALSCQQLRIHSTTNTDFYIHVTSKAIIEDCSSLRFGPNPGLELIPEDTWNKSGIQKSVNNWDQVGDFNWLAADKASPNWSKMEETIKSWDSLSDFMNISK